VAASEGWSGRRGSNPRPTAWKAVTLPLSYSRLRDSRSCAASPLRRGKPGITPSQHVVRLRVVPSQRTLRRDSLRRHARLAEPKPAFAIASAGLPSRSRACTTASARRRLVAREGLEPSKPLGRQIYSLLRLTASLPRQLSVLLETRASGCSYVSRWSWRRDLNPRPADYKSAALPTELRQPDQNANFSTSRATMARLCAAWRDLTSCGGGSTFPATFHCTQAARSGHPDSRLLHASGAVKKSTTDGVRVRCGF
jgi:hypothetical protein